MPTRVKNKVDQNGVIKRQVINQNGADRKRKPCCFYKSGCFRVLLSARAESCCPATRMLRNLREKSKAALGCLSSMRGKQLKISSSTLISSKQPAASFDSHRNQAVEDCISYINSSAAHSSTSSSSSSSTVTAILPPLKN